MIELTASTASSGTLIRLFVEAGLAEGARVTLGPEQAHYMLRGMRQSAAFKFGDCA